MHFRLVLANCSIFEACFITHLSVCVQMQKRFHDLERVIVRSVGISQGFDMEALDNVSAETVECESLECGEL